MAAPARGEVMFNGRVTGTSSSWLDLSTPRGLGDIYADCFRLYRRHLLVFAVTALAIAAVVDLLVIGLGDGRLTSGYEEGAFSDSNWGFVAGAAYALVSVPLITAIHVTAVSDVGAGRTPALGRTFQAALDVFPLVLATIILTTLGTALGVVLLIIPGIYVFVRWSLACPAAVVEEVDGPVDAIGRSWGLVAGSWWRVFGILLLTFILASLAGALVAAPLEIAAWRADSGILSLLASIVGNVVSLSFTALVTTLLYFDLTARRGRAADSAD